MIAYLVRFLQSTADNNDLRSAFGEDIFLGQTKQSDVTLVFSQLSFDEVKRRVALLPPLSDSQARFDIACLGQTEAV